MKAVAEVPWKAVLRAALLGAVMVGLVSCTPLPGGSLDPLVPTLGLPRGEERTSVQPRGAPPTRREWIGRYRDNRGEGEIALALTEEGSGLGGTWRLRTGGSGTFAGTLAPEGRTFAFTLQGSNPECPAAFAGRGEYLQDRIRGAYAGSDCLGAITGGSLELRRQ